MKVKYLYISLTLGVGMVLALLWLVGVGATAQAAPAAELHVCPSGCAYTSIQAAVDTAQTGDVIKVAQGSYTDVQNIPSLTTANFTATQIVAITKTITIRGGYTTTDWNVSDPDAHPTILDAGGLGRVLVISGTIAPEIAGFHMTGGNSTGLGGMYWGDVGGAIFISNASAVINSSQIYSNTATWYGGGLYLLNSDATVSDNFISENSTQDRGGGLYLDTSPATLVGNTFRSNTTGIRGGGVCSYWSVATISGNVFENNTAAESGGGMYLYGEGGTLNSNVFVNNQAGTGGGIYMKYEWGSTPTLINTALVGNQGYEGSGIWFGSDQSSSPGTVQALHTTIYNNRGGGEGVFVGEYASLDLTNTIIASHTVGINVTTGSTGTLNATLWYANITDRSGNVIHINDHTGDPVFAADGYHLTSASAAREAGVNAGVTEDIDGDARPQGSGYDIGADEFLSRIYMPLVVRSVQ